MSTVIDRKTPINTTWNLPKVQEHAALAVSNNFLAAYKALSKFGPDALKEFDKHINAVKADYYRSINIKTPIDLVKAMAEFEVNVFGSKIQIQGDEKKASLTYDSCAIWNSMQKIGKLTPDQEEKMGDRFQECLTGLAKEFGMNVTVNFEGETCCVVTFTK